MFSKKLSKRAIAVLLAVLLVTVQLSFVYAGSIADSSASQVTINQTMADEKVPTFEKVHFRSTYGDGDNAIFANGIVLIIDQGKDSSEADVEDMSSIYFIATDTVTIGSSNIEAGKGYYINFDEASSTISYQEEYVYADFSGFTIFGGANAESVQSTSIIMNGGSLENIYGGGYARTSGGDVVGNTNVNINNAYYVEAVFGGGLRSNVGGNTNVTISNAELSSVIGGGEAGDLDDGSVSANVGGSTNVNISSSKIENRVVGGGSAYARFDTSKCISNVLGSSNVTISNSTIVENIYAGGSVNTYQDVGDALSASVASTNLKITGGTRATDVYAGGYGQAGVSKVVGNTLVDISGSGNTFNNVFGGGLSYSGHAYVGGNTNVNIASGTTVTQSVYGGGNADMLLSRAVSSDTSSSLEMNTSIVAGNTYLNIAGNIGTGFPEGIYGVFGGGCNRNSGEYGFFSSYVLGDTNININGGSTPFVFGAGQFAEVEFNRAAPESFGFANFVKGNTNINIYDGSVTSVLGGGDTSMLGFDYDRTNGYVANPSGGNVNIKAFGGTIGKGTNGGIFGTGIEYGDFSSYEGEAPKSSETYEIYSGYIDISGKVFVFVDDDVNLKNSIRESYDRQHEDTPIISTIVLEQAGSINEILESGEAKDLKMILPNAMVDEYVFGPEGENFVDNILRLTEFDVTGFDFSAISSSQELIDAINEKGSWGMNHWMIKGDVVIPSDVAASIEIKQYQELYIPNEATLTVDGTLNNNGFIITKKADISQKNSPVSDVSTVASRIYRGDVGSSFKLDSAVYAVGDTAAALKVDYAKNDVWNMLAGDTSATGNISKVTAPTTYAWLSGTTPISGVTGDSYTPSTAEVGSTDYKAEFDVVHNFESVPASILNNKVVTNSAVITVVDKFTVKFEDETFGNTPSIHEEQKVTDGSAATRPTTNPTDSNGGTFESWNTGTNGSGSEWNFSDPITKDMTLYPVFKYTLTVNGGTGSGEFLGDSNAPVNLGAIPAGQEFAGWDLNGDGTVDTVNRDFIFIMPFADIVITAIYRTATTPTTPTPAPTSTTSPTTPPTVTPIPTYTLTVEDGNGDGQYQGGTEVDVTFTGPTPDGQEFVGWDTDGDGDVDVVVEDFTFTMPNADTVISPVYEDITHTLTVEDGDGDGDYPAGEEVEVTFTGPEPDGQEFEGWDTDGDGEVDVTEKDFIFTMPDGDATITPVYKDIEDTHTLTVEDGDGDGEYPTGEQVEVTFTGPEPDGQEFVGWDTDGDGEVDVTEKDFIFTMPNGDATITPVYQPVGGSSGGIDDPDVNPDGGITVHPGTNGELPTNVKVNGQDLDENDYTIDDNGNLTINPDYFRDLPDGTYTLSVDIGGQTYESTVIVEDGVPLSAGPFNAGGAWSLFDLICTIIATLAPIVYLIIVRKRDEDNNNPEDEKTSNKRVITILVSAILGIALIILLLLTQDFTLPMTIFDIWSVVFAVVLVVQLLFMIIFKRKNNDNNRRRPRQVDNFA